MKENKAIFTKGIPICPKCMAPTKRQHITTQKTLLYYPPIYDEKGVNTNPDKNIQTCKYFCQGCRKYYGIEGNRFDGFIYSIKK